MVTLPHLCLRPVVCVPGTPPFLAGGSPLEGQRLTPLSFPRASPRAGVSIHILGFSAQWGLLSIPSYPAGPGCWHLTLGGHTGRNSGLTPAIETSGRLHGPQGGGTHVSEGQEHRIEVQEGSKEDEEGSEAGDAHANLCNR